MAGLTKEQRAQCEAERLATGQGSQNIIEQGQGQGQGQEQEQEQAVLVAMVTDAQPFPGAPTTADVHSDEVENWQALGWRLGD